MRLRSLAVAVPLVLALSACGGSADAEATSTPESVAEDTQEAETVAAAQDSGEMEPCFRVGEVGSQLMMTWELVVAARGASDQQDYIDDLMDEGEDFYEDAEDQSLCAGYQEIADFNYQVANLNMSIALGEDTDQMYEDIADVGNELIELSDDEGYEWDYEFVSDVSEL